MLSRYIFSLSKPHFPSLWKNTKLLEYVDTKVACSLDLVRHKARKGTRAAALAAKKARKLQDANKPPPIPKYLQRKVKVSAALEKVRCTDENWLEEQPIDDVWNMKLYRGNPSSVKDALNFLRSMHEPSLLNDPTAVVNTRIEVDLKLKKKDKILDDFSGVVIFPHEFDVGKKNRIIALCKESEDQLKATEAGALYAGSTTLVKQILSGTLSSEDFDYVVCHPDMYKECNSLRGILKRRFPTAHNGQLRLDVDKAVSSFIQGVEYNLTRSAIEPDFGWVEIYVGRLNMQSKEIEENLKHVLSMIDKHTPAGISHLFILRTLLWCEKVREKVKIPHWDYLPHYPENGVLVEDDEEDMAKKGG